MVASVPNDIFQFSTYTAVRRGFSTGQPRTTDLTTHGTDGIGIFEDGTLMLLLSSFAYKIQPNGLTTPAPPDSRLAFAMVTVFEPTHALKSHSGMWAKDMVTLEQTLVSAGAAGGIGGPNSMLPFKIEGTFEEIGLINPTLFQRDGSVATEGAEERLENIRGTVFGFAVPAWMEGISGPGLHCHFVSDEEGAGGEAGEMTNGNGVGGEVRGTRKDRKGGRVFRFKLRDEAQIEVGKCGRFHLGFPQGREWENMVLR